MISNTPISVDRQHHDDPDAVLVLKDIMAMKSPCDTCELAKHCKDNFEACNQFYLFIHREDESERPEGDMPSRKIYNGLFPEETEEERRELRRLNEVIEALK